MGTIWNILILRNIRRIDKIRIAPGVDSDFDIFFKCLSGSV